MLLTYTDAVHLAQKIIDQLQKKRPGRHQRPADFVELMLFCLMCYCDDRGINYEDLHNSTLKKHDDFIGEARIDEDAAVTV